MKCVIEKENEELKEENIKLKKEIVDIQNKVRELMQNFGKDKDKNGSQ